MSDLGTTFKRGLTVFRTLRAIDWLTAAVFGVSIWALLVAFVDAYTGVAFVVLGFLAFLLMLGRWGRVQIRAAWGWRNHLPWGILWTYDALISIRKNQHGVFVGGFWISGLNRSRSPIELASARIVSLVTGQVVEAKAATDPHYVSIDQIKPIPPKAVVSLQFLLYDPATADGEREGLPEETFWKDFGEFEFQAIYGGKTHRRRFSGPLLEAYFNQARRPGPPRPSPRVTVR